MRGTHRRLIIVALALLSAIGVAACGGGGDNGDNGGGGGGGGKKIAQHLPETKNTRYEAKDRPLITAKVKQLCPDCQILYSNASQDAAKQQQQAEAAITNGANVLVLDAVDVKSVGSIVKHANQKKIPVIA